MQGEARFRFKSLARFCFIQNKTTIMVKHSLSSSQDKLNPLFQHHYLQGRVHARDYAFYMRKLSFMQQQQKPAAEKKEENRSNHNS